MFEKGIVPLTNSNIAAGHQYIGSGYYDLSKRISVCEPNLNDIGGVFTSDGKYGYFAKAIRSGEVVKIVLYDTNNGAIASEKTLDVSSDSMFSLGFPSASESKLRLTVSMSFSDVNQHISYKYGYFDITNGVLSDFKEDGQEESGEYSYTYSNSDGNIFEVTSKDGFISICFDGVSRNLDDVRGFTVVGDYIICQTDHGVGCYRYDGIESSISPCIKWGFSNCFPGLCSVSGGKRYVYSDPESHVSYLLDYDGNILKSFNDTVMPSSVVSHDSYISSLDFFYSK